MHLLDVGGGAFEKVAYSSDNLEPTDIAVHFSVLGQIHQQVKELPEGTRISEIRIE